MSGAWGHIEGPNMQNCIWILEATLGLTLLRRESPDVAHPHLRSLRNGDFSGRKSKSIWAI